jgi:hypothetical protein
MQKPPSTNHGEGNPEAAEHFNSAERQFVESERGKKKISEGPKVRPSEEADLAEAERIARAHAKDDDSDTNAMADKSGRKS